MRRESDFRDLSDLHAVHLMGGGFCLVYPITPESLANAGLETRHI